ncbi:MAG: 30S ribosome-binding factor RbfA [Chloroflexi bacterium]|nr:30S ribosome-binding factor RbfA [Chloroflexota bacterium]
MSAKQRPDHTGRRAERLGERIHQEISLLLGREVSDPRLAGVNVTRVQVSSDLRLAKVYVTPRESDEENSEMMDALTRASGYFRHHLAQSLDLHFAPEVRFYLDRGIEMGEHFLQVLHQVQTEGEQASQDQTKKRRTQP